MDIMPVAEGVTNTVTGGGIVGNITESFTGFLGGIGQGITDFFQTIFTNADGSMSVFAIVSLSMIGLGLGAMIMRKLIAMVRK